MLRPGNRLYFTAYVLLLVVAALHSMGTSQPWPTDEKTQALVASMQGYTMEMIGRTTDVQRLYKGLSWTMSIMLVGFGFVGIAGLATAPRNRQLHRSAGFVSLAVSAGLAALYWHYQVMPPCVSFAVVSLVLLIALATSTVGREQDEGAP